MSNFVKPGIGSVGQYQMSGRPYTKTVTVGPDTASNYGVMLEFDNVTSSITFKDNSGTGSQHDDILLHFTASAPSARTSKNYIVIKPGETIKLDVRTRRVYLSHRVADAGGNGGHQTEMSVFAEITNIEDDINYES